MKLSSAAPAGASFFSSSSSRKATSPSYVSVSELKLASKARLGAGSKARNAAIAGLGASLTLVGIAAGVDMEYRCQPSSMCPAMRTSTLPPAGAAGGSTLSFQVTCRSPWASCANSPLANRNSPKITGFMRKSGSVAILAGRPGLLLARARVAGGEAADPDVAEAHGLGVVLQTQGFLGCVRSVLSDLPPDGGAQLLPMIVHQHAIEEHGEIRRRDELAVREGGRLEQDVVDIPFALRAGGVDQRRPDSVHGAGGAIGIGQVLVGFQHLDFVAPHQFHAAIAAGLSGAGSLLGNHPLDMQLAIAELFLGDQAAGPRDDHDVAVLHFPLGFLELASANLLHPVREILAIKQHDGVGGRSGIRQRPGRHLGGAAPLHVVYLPLLIGQLRCIVIPAGIVTVGCRYAVARRRGLFGLLGRRLRGQRSGREHEDGDFHGGTSRNKCCHEILTFGLRVGAVQQGAHVGEAIGGLRVAAADQPGRVIENHDAIVVHVAQRLHDLVHVVVAVIHEGLDEVRQRRADIAEVNLPDLVGAEVADHLLGILAGELLAALQPGAAAHADADIGTVGNFQRPFVAIEVAEDAARHAGQHGDRRIVGMDADAHARFVGNRRHLLDEVSEVLPDLFLGKYAPVGERLLPGLAVPYALLVGAGHVEFAAGGAADGGAPTAPDAVAHVGVGGVVDPRLAQIADVLFVLLHFLIAARQIERHLGHVVNAGIADVPHGDAGITVWNIGNTSVHNMPEVTLNLPGRDQKVEEYKQYIRNLGKAGIYYTTYAHMGNGIWSSGRATIRRCPCGR